MKKQYKILHLFQWKLNDITNMLNKINDQGFNAILISPIQECRDGYEWWKLYQNYSYKIGNRLGTDEDLKNLCEQANMLGIDIIADVLFHNVASKTGEDVHPKVNNILAKYVDIEAPKCEEYEDRYQTTNYSVGLPIVKYNNNVVKLMHIIMLSKLKNLGVKGFRVDMAKHFSLPSEGSVYFTDVFEPFIKEGTFVFGEVLDSKLDVLDKYAEIMHVCTNKRVTDKNKQVSFFESHDTYHTWGNTKYLTKEQMVYEWNKLVNVEKTHSIFFARPMEDEKHLDNMWLSDEIRGINLGGN